MAYQDRIMRIAKNKNDNGSAEQVTDTTKRTNLTRRPSRPIEQFVSSMSRAKGFARTWKYAVVITPPANLKLLALNDDDLKVLSAHLQDSVVLVKDIIFLKKSRTFLMMVNRFMWEDIELGIFRENKRIRCAVKFENVLEVKSRNISQKKKR